jgi:hypothetical protein
MVWVLNLAWVVLATLMCWLWMRHARREGPGRQTQFIALALVLVAMFAMKLLPMALAATLAMSGCKSDKVNADAEAPPPAKVISGVDVSFFAVEHPELYPIVTATEYQAPSQLFVTGTVFPDISRMFR